MPDLPKTVTLDISFVQGGETFAAALISLGCVRGIQFTATTESVRSNMDVLLQVLAPEIEERALQIVADREEEKAQRLDRQRDY